MNEEQYRSLCEACDRLLLAPDAGVERTAIPWLHVIREHPVFLAGYADLFDPTPALRVFVRRALRVLRNTIVWWRQLARALCAREPWFEAKALPARIDVLFVSHLINVSHAGQEDDFYFGNVPKMLVAEGRPAAIALINYSGRSASAVSREWAGNSLPRAVLSGSLAVREELAMRARLKSESRRLRALAREEKSELTCRVLSRASEEALSNGAQATLRIAAQVSALVARLRPRALVVTHEGHAWERIVFAAARGVHPEIRCFAYQHAALFRLQHAIRRGLAAPYNPELILAAGAAGKAGLERAPGLGGTPVSILGSNRGFKGRVQSEPAPARDACLVLPDGIPSECHLLFEFSLACVEMFPALRFIWRLHPILTYQSLARQNPRLRKLPPNIELSSATLLQDAARCRWALYRGTTAIVQAVGAGVRPVYVRVPGEMTIDPLYELKAWKADVGGPEEFKRLAASDAECSPTDIETAKKFCADFFLPFDHRALVDALDDHGAAATRENRQTIGK